MLAFDSLRHESIRRGEKHYRLDFQVRVWPGISSVNSRPFAVGSDGRAARPPTC